MKKIFSFIALLAGVISFTSCSDDYPPMPDSASSFEIISNDVYFEAAGGTGSIVVNTADAVTAETTSNWLTVSVNDKTITVTAQGNAAFDGRSALIVLKAGTATTSVTAIQKGNVYQLNGDHSYSVASGAATLNVSVMASTPITAQSLVDWMDAAYHSEDSEVVVDIAANSSTESRTGQVVIDAGGFKDTLTISQRGVFVRPPLN